MNMRERIARRLCALNYGDPDIEMKYGSLAWTIYVNDADEVLDELMKPTGEMAYNGAKAHMQFYDDASEPEERGHQPQMEDIAQFDHAYRSAIKSAIEGK